MTSDLSRQSRLGLLPILALAALACSGFSEDSIVAVLDGLERLAVAEGGTGGAATDTPDRIIDRVRDKAAALGGFASWREFAEKAGSFDHQRFTTLVAERERRIRERLASPR